ncbi:MAG: 50S ribosomal protein L25 [Planctomycetota bacterium]
MAIVELKAARRERLGSAEARRLRRSGSVPVVIYGHRQDPLHLSVNAKELTLAVRKRVHMFRLQTDDLAEQVIVKDLAYDHLGDTLEHVDFLRVDLHEAVEVNVSVEVRGHPKGLAEGGILEQHMATVPVRCTPDRIPEVVIVHVEHLELHGAVRVRDLQLPDGVVATGDPEAPVASVVMRYKVQPVAAEPVAAAEGEAAEAAAEPAAEQPEETGRKEKERDAGRKEK